MQVFDSKGQFLFTFGNYGHNDDQFDGPTGIAVNSKDEIICGQYRSPKVKVFDRNGKFLLSFGSGGK